MIHGKSHFYWTAIDFDLLDAGNVVYHPNYLILCERARNRALRDAGYDFKDLWADGFALALSETKTRYMRPAEFGDSIVIVTKMLGGSGVRFEVEQTMVRAAVSYGTVQGFSSPVDPKEFGEELFSLWVCLACVKLNPVRPSRPPVKLMECLQFKTAKPMPE
jgi:acyl-CoA thioester hydrolase